MVNGFMAVVSLLPTMMYPALVFLEEMSFLKYSAKASHRVQL